MTEKGPTAGLPAPSGLRRALAGIVALVVLALVAAASWALGYANGLKEPGAGPEQAAAAGEQGGSVPEATSQATQTQPAAPDAGAQDQATSSGAGPGTAVSPGTGPDADATAGAAAPGQSASPGNAVAAPAPWSAWDGAAEERDWISATEALGAPAPARVTVSQLAGNPSPGAQVFADVIASGDKARLTRACWTRSPEYVQRVYLGPARGAILAALSHAPMGSQNGPTWRYGALVAGAGWDEAGSSFMCPDVTLDAVQADVLPADVTWMVHRYVRVLAGAPVSPNEPRYDKGCRNDMDTGWNPLGAGQEPEPIPFWQLPAQPLGAPPAIAGPPSLSIARNVVDGRAYYAASGHIPLTDGTSPLVTFELSDGWAMTRPCLGDVYLGGPHGG